MHPDVLALHADLARWQTEAEADGLPSETWHRELALRTRKYLQQAKKQRVRLLRQAYPPDVEFITAFHLDCLQHGEGFHDGVLWRSAAEKNLFGDIRGWCEDGDVKRRQFHPLSDVVKSIDVVAKECFAVLQSHGPSLDMKLSSVAHLLDCTPSIPGIAEALSQRLLFAMLKGVASSMAAGCAVKTFHLRAS